MQNHTVFWIHGLMGAGPRKSEDNRENQGIAWNVQIKIRQAVQQNGDDASDTSKRDGFVIIRAAFFATAEGEPQSPENRPKHENGPRQTELRYDFQVIAVSVINNVVKESGLHGGINSGK